MITAINHAKFTAEWASDQFTEWTRELFKNDGGYVYHIKDLRKTWVTNMLKEYSHEQVRLAAGHADIKTTLKHYVEDGREMADDVYIPGAQNDKKDTDIVPTENQVLADLIQKVNPELAITLLQTLVNASAGTGKKTG